MAKKESKEVQVIDPESQEAKAAKKESLEAQVIDPKAAQAAKKEI